MSSSENANPTAPEFADVDVLFPNPDSPDAVVDMLDRVAVAAFLIKSWLDLALSVHSSCQEKVENLQKTVVKCIYWLDKVQPRVRRLDPTLQFGKQTAAEFIIEVGTDLCELRGEIASMQLLLPLALDSVAAKQARRHEDPRGEATSRSDDLCPYKSLIVLGNRLSSHARTLASVPLKLSSALAEGTDREGRKQLAARAEQEVSVNGYPGLNELARRLNVPPSSLSNSIKESSFLEARKAEHEDKQSPKNREVPLTQGHLETLEQQTEPNPKHAALTKLIAEQDDDNRRADRQAKARCYGRSHNRS